MSVKPPPIKVFYSYANADESLCNELEKHLSILRHLGLISSWYSRKIVAGTNWAETISAHLETASLILLLISPDFLASDYCYGVEMKRALERHQAKQVRVIPILLRPVEWRGAPFEYLEALPTDAKSVTLWSNRDEAFANVATGIQQTIEDLLRPGVSTPRVYSSSVWNISAPRESSAQSRKKFFSPKKILGFVLFIALLLSLGVGGFVLLHPASPSQKEQAIQQYMQATSGLPTIDDTLNERRSLWDQNEDCNFVDGGYHVTGQVTYSLLAGCSFSGQFQDFAFQAQMTLLRGAGGGLLFRKAGDSFGYRFFLGLNGVDLSYKGSALFSLSNGPKALYNHAELLAVLVKGSTIALYINNVWRGTVRDTDNTHASSGSIGFLIYQPDNSTTEAVFRNARLWVL